MATNDKDEIDLFREAIKGATPLKISPKKKEHKAPQKKPKPVPLNFIRDEKQALIDSISDHYELLHDIENGEELFYIRQGHSPDILKRGMHMEQNSRVSKVQMVIRRA